MMAATLATFAACTNPAAFTPEGSRPPGEFGVNALITPSQAMRRGPRYERLCAKLDLCQFWASTGQWPDCTLAVAPCHDREVEVGRLP